MLFCALDDSVQTGECYSNGQPMDHTSLPVSVYDKGLAKKLWEASEKLTETFNKTNTTNALNRRKIVTNDFYTELKIKLEQHGRAE